MSEATTRPTSSSTSHAGSVAAGAVLHGRAVLNGFVLRFVRVITTESCATVEFTGTMRIRI
jgi:hypothetical protein